MKRRGFLAALPLIPMAAMTLGKEEKEIPSPAVPTDKILVIDADGNKHRVMIEASPQLC